jgi:hypothetical protein
MHLSRSDIGYVGLLGPAARRDDLLRETGEIAAAPPAAARVGGLVAGW